LSTLPNHRYYETLAGDWAAPFEFRISDEGLFWSRPLGLLNRLRVISMVISRWFIGRPRIETKVDYRPDANEVHHQLRILKWGIRFYQSNEVLQLHEDGRTLSIRGEQRMFPLMGSPEDLGQAPGEINETGTQAHYTLQWMGGPLEIRTQMVDGGADIQMDTGWGGGTQKLRAR